MEAMDEMMPRSSHPEETAHREMELPVSADGVVTVHIPVLNDTETLTVDVSHGAGPTLCQTVDKHGDK